MKKYALSIVVGSICLLALLGASTSQSLTIGNSIDSEYKWYKGNTHTHTLWSDGNDFPETVADWYKNNGYQFLVLSDHNILSQGEKWKNISKHITKNDIVTKHNNHWGKGQLELKFVKDRTLAKLKTLEEVKALVEEPEKFIMIQGMELTSRAGIGKDKKKLLPVHGNVINIDEEFIPKQQTSVAEQISHHNDIISSYIKKTEHPVFWHINHPNFKYANTAEQIAEHAHDANGLEIFNSGGGTHNTGDEHRPNVERIWDIANTIRLKEYGWPPLFGCATDDTHNYHTSLDDYHSGEVLRDVPGLAWVMVHSKSLTSDAITKAMRLGDFYSTTGVLLSKLDYDSNTRKISLEVDAKKGVKYTITFIGTPKDVSLNHEVPEPIVEGNGLSHPITATYTDTRIGMVLSVVNSHKASYKLSSNDLYVRAVITSDEKPTATIDDGPIEKKAWTQPFGWKEYVSNY